MLEPVRHSHEHINMQLDNPWSTLFIYRKHSHVFDLSNSYK